MILMGIVTYQQEPVLAGSYAGKGASEKSHLLGLEEHTLIYSRWVSYRLLGIHQRTSRSDLPKDGAYWRQIWTEVC